MLDSTLLKDLQGDLGIDASQTVFTDAELERLYTRANSNQDLAVYYGFRQLLASANKFFDYTAGLTTEKRSQVRAQLKESCEMWLEEVNQVASLGAVGVPTQNKSKPWSKANNRGREEQLWLTNMQ